MRSPMPHGRPASTMAYPRASRTTPRMDDCRHGVPVPLPAHTLPGRLPWSPTCATTTPSSPKVNLVEVEHKVQLAYVAEVVVEDLHEQVDGLQAGQLVV